MVELQTSNLDARVRFPSSAPTLLATKLAILRKGYKGEQMRKQDIVVDVFRSIDELKKLVEEMPCTVKRIMANYSFDESDLKELYPEFNMKMLDRVTDRDIEMNKMFEETQKKLKAFDNLTKADFVKMKDEELWDAAIMWTDKFSPFDNEGKAFLKAPSVIQNFIAVIMLDGQVLNGGFVQFYYNGYNNLGIDYVQAFKNAGLDKLAQIISEANKVYETIKHTFPSTDNYDTDAFTKLYEDSPLSQFDERYAELEEEKDKAIIKFVRDNIQHFGN